MFWCSDVAYRWFVKNNNTNHHFDIDFTQQSDFEVFNRFKEGSIIGAAYELENGKPIEILVDNYDAKNNCMVQSYGKKFYHQYRGLSGIIKKLQKKNDLSAQKSEKAKNDKPNPKPSKKPKFEPLFNLDEQPLQAPKSKPQRKTANLPRPNLPPPLELFF